MTVRTRVAASALLVSFPSFGFAGPFDVKSGPAVGDDFDVVAFSEPFGEEVVFVAWRDAQSNVAAGTLHLDDEAFDPFPALLAGYITNLSVGTGGPAWQRHAHVSWVGNQADLFLATYDPIGAIIMLPAEVGRSVQVTPSRFVATDAGALVAHSWDDGFYWDPRILEVDLTGNPVATQIADDVPAPEQTLGVTVVSEPGGARAIGYITSDTRRVRVRRYDIGGFPFEESPVLVSEDSGPDYHPHSSLFIGGEEPSTMLMAFPYAPAGADPDVRFATVPLSSDPVTEGPLLSSLAAGFSGGITDMAALADAERRAVVTWQTIEYKDPKTCGCSAPPPADVRFFAQVVELGDPIVAVADPVLVYRWMTGDEIGPPRTPPHVVVASATPGRFTLVWSDGTLRYTDVDANTVDAGASPAPVPPNGASVQPNPFSASTTIRFGILPEGARTIWIHDVTGRNVRTLSIGSGEAGSGAVAWDGRDADGRPLPAGVYVARTSGAVPEVTFKLTRLP